jgi:3-hydroxyisobutyrate dehydrogenase-like beta-hydroxyacid dehydrogenase
LSDQIGFIGLGKMGLGMARNLAKAGHQLVVHDVSPQAMQSLEPQGVRVGASAADVAKGSSIVFLCVPDAPQVRDVLAGSDGVLAGATPGTLVIDHTTMNRLAAVELSQLCVAGGLEYCDCPVSGMPFRADDGSLTIMFGGADETFERVKPYLDVTGDFIVNCGDVGAGQLMKAINNVIYDVNIAALCEVLPLAQKAGLDTANLAKVVTTASARSFASEYFVPRIMRGEFHTDFTLGGAYKDIQNVQEVAVELRAPTPVVNAMIAVYQSAMTAGYSDEPKSAMIKLYEEALGVEFRGEPPAKEG